MKRIIGILIVALTFLIAVPTALASTSVAADKTTALPGETVTVSGTAGAHDSVVIKITDEAGNIVYFDGAKADESGKYWAAFTVPSDMAAGELTVTAGSGSDVATTTIQVTSPPVTPTPTPAATPQPTTVVTPTPELTATSTPGPAATSSPKPGATSTPKPGTTPTPRPATTPTPAHSPSATPAASASPMASPDTAPTPSPSPAGSQTASPMTPAPTTPDTSPAATTGQSIVIRPAAVEQDEESGTVTIRIHVSDLPQGTYAVKTSGGEIIYVKDSQDGILTIAVNKDALRQDGTIELITIDESMAPAGAVSVQVRDVPQRGGVNTFVWIVGGLILLGAAFAATIVIRKKRQTDHIS